MGELQEWDCASGRRESYRTTAMPSAAKISRLLLESAATMSQAVSAKAIVIPVDGLAADVEAVPPRSLLVVRDDADIQRAESMADSGRAQILVPNVELNRMGQVKLAAIMALSNRLIALSDRAVFLTGPYRSLVDSMVVMTMGAEYELLDTTHQPEIDEHIKRAVFHRVLEFALHLGQHGREGKKVGCLLVVGDSERVIEQSVQMILNPFKGYDENERNILDDAMQETMREYSTLDGAFIIRRNGVVEMAGARLKVSAPDALPPGLGSRHAAAAGVTSTTKSIAISVSESDGTVRVWRAGKMAASFEAG